MKFLQTSFFFSKCDCLCIKQYFPKTVSSLTKPQYPRYVTLFESEIFTEVIKLT